MNKVHQFKEGEIVFERVRPAQKLVIQYRIGLLYYCRACEQPNRKHLVFFEHELRKGYLQVIRMHG